MGREFKKDVPWVKSSSSGAFHHSDISDFFTYVVYLNVKVSCLACCLCEKKTLLSHQAIERGRHIEVTPAGHWAVSIVSGRTRGKKATDQVDAVRGEGGS